MSATSDDELAALKQAAAYAYRRVRDDVIDQFPPGTRIDEGQLSPDQRDAMYNLRRADDALVAFRDRQLSGPPAPRTSQE
jgi:hypothetical protein